MASVTPDPNSTRPPAFGERVVFATYGGRMYARKWPRKVGPSPLPYQQETVQRFIDANYLAKHCAPEQIIEAMRATKRTGLYPRDLLTKTMLTGLFDIVLPDGQIVTRAPLTYEVPVFEGFRIYRTVNFPFAAGAAVEVPWQGAELNAIGLWDPLNPTYITVPNGVSVMEFSATVTSSTLGSMFMVAAISLVGGAKRRARSSERSNGEKSLSLSTGPCAVVAGEQWSLRIFSDIPATLTGTQDLCAFSGTILG